MKFSFKIACLLAAYAFCANAHSVELYLPINLDIVAENNIEKLFVLANLPAVKRPYTIAKVEAALKKIKGQHPALENNVKTYLKRYKQNAGVTHATLSLSSSDDNGHITANDRGESTNSNYHLRARGFAKIGDSIIFNMGGRYSSDPVRDSAAIPEGTFVSTSKYNLQMDLGYRAHSFSPFRSGSMLISTNAPAIPSITLSNPEMYSFLGLSYELFWGQLSESDKIRSEDGSERLSGNPKLLGLHVGLEPIDGFAISFNRLLQYGGADRDDSISSFMQAFFNVKSNENAGAGKSDFGNQQSSINTSYTFGGAMPFALYLEYAGEDTSQTSDVHLGNTSIMLGAYLPTLTENSSLRYEYAEWQNGWYINGNYGDGLTNDSLILGHWAANERSFTPAYGAKSQTAEFIYSTPKHCLIATIRQVENQEYSSFKYSPGYEISIDYSRPYKSYRYGLKAMTGTDVFDQSYSLLSGYVQW